MENLIEIENLIKEIKAQGIDFGKGDPYNRLRYYTKIGWLPHMTRKKTDSSSAKGHYPLWVIKRIITIEKLRAQGLTNEEISDKLNTHKTLSPLYESLGRKGLRLKLVYYSIIFLLFITFLYSAGLINTTNRTISDSTLDVPNQIVKSGANIVPQGKRSTYIKASEVNMDSKIYVNFSSNYAPATRFWVTNIENEKGFSIELDAPVVEDSSFFWWISQ